MIGFGVTAFLAQIPSARLAGRLGMGRLILYSCVMIPLAFLLWPSKTGYVELLVLYMVAAAGMEHDLALHGIDAYGGDS